MAHVDGTIGIPEAADVDQPLAEAVAGEPAVSAKPATVATSRDGCATSAGMCLGAIISTGFASTESSMVAESESRVWDVIRSVPVSDSAPEKSGAD